MPDCSWRFLSKHTLRIETLLFLKETLLVIEKNKRSDLYVLNIGIILAVL